MSDILIKGMEMPKEGNVHLIIGEDGVVSEKIGSMYHVTTEAIELPPHGDLKDYDFIGNKMSNTYEKNKDKWNPNFADGFIYALKMLDKAPTIVEANNGSDN